MKIRTLVFVLILSSFSLTLAAEPSSWKELNEQALRLYQKSKYMEATEVTKKALEIAKQQFGYQSLEAAESLGNLGALYEIQGNSGEAKPLYKQAREIRAKYGRKGIPLGIQTEVFFRMLIKERELKNGIMLLRLRIVFIIGLVVIYLLYLIFRIRKRKKSHLPKN